MVVKDLKGKTYSWNISENKYPLRTANASKSKLQYGCGQLLKEKFQLDIILEEVGIPGEKLALDFFIPSLKLAFEVHGVQHDKYVPHFHGSVENFKHAKACDKRKEQWCKINNIELYVVRSEEEMKELLCL